MTCIFGRDERGISETEEEEAMYQGGAMRGMRP